jgi:hypothetical protein
MVIEYKLYVLIFSTAAVCLILRIERDIIIGVHVGVHLMHTLLLSDLLNLDFRDRFSKNTQIQNFMKFRPVGADQFQAEGRTDGQTDRQT